MPVIPAPSLDLLVLRQREGQHRLPPPAKVTRIRLLGDAEKPGADELADEIVGLRSQRSSTSASESRCAVRRSTTMPLSRSDSTLRAHCWACVLLSKVLVCAGRPARRTFTRQNWPRFSMVAIGQFSWMAFHPVAPLALSQNCPKMPQERPFRKQQRSRKLPRSLFRRRF